MNRVSISFCSLVILLCSCASVSSSETVATKPRVVPASAVRSEVMRNANDSTPAQIAGYAGFSFSVRAYVSDGKTTYAYPRITELAPRSPADSAGIRVGDDILEVNGRDARELGAVRLTVGMKTVFRMRRGDREFEITLVPIVRTIKPRW